jgi:antitoxin VapB
MPIAKIFRNGSSQAVRLPKGYRFGPETREVSIRREGEVITLEPVRAREWPEELWQAFEGMPDDFERPVQLAQQREPLDP